MCSAMMWLCLKSVVLMTEKRFTIHKESKYKEEWYAYPFCIKEEGEVVLETIPLSIAEKVRDKLNEQQATISALKEENEQLRKQIQNYEQLISNSYVGEEETLDGFTGKYVIWENELQKYKNKNEVINNG